MSSLKQLYNRAVRTGIGAASIPWCGRRIIFDDDSESSDDNNILQKDKNDNVIDEYDEHDEHGEHEEHDNIIIIELPDTVTKQFLRDYEVTYCIPVYPNKKPGKYETRFDKFLNTLQLSIDFNCNSIDDYNMIMNDRKPNHINKNPFRQIKEFKNIKTGSIIAIRQGIYRIRAIVRIISSLYYDNSKNKYNLSRNVEIIVLGNSKIAWGRMQSKTVGRFK